MIDFKELVKALEAHPDIWVARAQFLPGASPEDLNRAEAHLGAPLAPEIRAFYEHHNGLAIEWVFKSTDRFRDWEHEVDTSELPFWMDLLEGYTPPFDGQIIVVPLDEVLVDSYASVEEPSGFEPEIAYVEFFEEPLEPSEESFAFGERQYASEAAFRAHLRIFDYYLRDEGNLLLFEPGNSDPDLLQLEEHWHNFDPRRVLPLSQYLKHLAYDFGLRWNRDRYFRGADPAPVIFDPTDRLAQLISETKFPGDLRET